MIGVLTNIPSYQYLENPMYPAALSIEVKNKESFESEYRLRIGNQAKYIIISPKTYDRDTLSFLIQSLLSLP